MEYPALNIFHPAEERPLDSNRVPGFPVFHFLPSNIEKVQRGYFLLLVYRQTFFLYETSNSKVGRYIFCPSIHIFYPLQRISSERKQKVHPLYKGPGSVVQNSGMNENGPSCKIRQDGPLCQNNIFLLVIILCCCYSPAGRTGAIR